MDLNEIIKNGSVLLTCEQAVVCLIMSLKKFVNYVKKAQVVKKTIDDFSFDAYFNGINEICIDEKEIKSLLNSCDKTIQIAVQEVVS